MLVVMMVSVVRVRVVVMGTCSGAGDGGRCW